MKERFELSRDKGKNVKSNSLEDNSRMFDAWNSEINQREGDSGIAVQFRGPRVRGAVRAAAREAEA